MGLLDKLSKTEMYQLAGLFANMPTTSGGRNPLQPMAGYWSQAGEREEAEKRRKLQDEMNQKRFGMDMYAQNNAINQQARDNKRQDLADQRKGEMYQASQNYANSFNPQSSLYSTPGILAGAGPQEINQFQNQQSLLAGMAPVKTTPDPTSVREFKYAKQNGYQGGYQDFLNDKKSNTNININTAEGKQPLTNSTATETQKDLSALDESISRFRNLEKLYDPEYLTNQGKIKGGVFRFFDKWGVNPDTFPGENNENFLAGITTHKQAVEQEFNQYRKEITGAAAALAELDRLMKTFLNTDLSPTQYKASYKQIMEKMNKAAEIKRTLLREGLDVNSQEFKEKADKMYLSGKSKNQPPYPGLSGGGVSSIDDLVNKYRTR